MYREQFPFCPAPAGFKWEPIIYSFDPTNTPALSVLLSSGQETDDIPLLLDSDADFYWCGTRASIGGLQMQLKIPYTNPVMDQPIEDALYAGLPLPPAVMEPLFTFCPKGSAVTVKLRQP